jgi:type IX secretion system PorP/SprF family membrane protein
MRALVQLFTALAITLYAGVSANAQQLPVSGLPLAHPFDAHPAVAGMDTVLRATMWNHSQWSRIADAPRTTALSITAPIKEKPLAWGLRATSDVVGPTRRGSLHGAMAYRVDWNEQVKVAFGLSVGLVQYTLDGSRITLEQAGDPALPGASQARVLPDALASIWIEGGVLFGGATLHQLLGNTLRFSDPSTGDAKLEDHFTALVGCKFERENWVFKPVIQLTHLRPAPPDINAQVEAVYKSSVWGTLGYRNTGGVTLGLGTRVHNRLIARYAYEVNAGPLAGVIGGGHTVVLSLTVPH